MASDDLELIPPEGTPEKSGNGTTYNQTTNIGQFIQLVNKHSELPDGKQLDSYSPADKEWIKRRMEIEQEHRHGLMHKMAENQQVLTTNSLKLNHEANIAKVVVGMIIILTSLLLCGLLLYLKVGWLSLGLPAIVLCAPVSLSISNYLINKLKGVSQTDSNLAATEKSAD